MKQEKPTVNRLRIMGLIGMGVVLLFGVLPFFTFEFWQIVMVQLIGLRAITNIGQVGMLDVGLLLLGAVQYFILRERWDE